MTGIAVRRCFSPRPGSQPPGASRGAPRLRRLRLLPTRRRGVKGSAHLEPLQLAVILEGEGTLAGRKVRAGEVWHEGPRAIPVEGTGNFVALCVSVW